MRIINNKYIYNNIKTEAQVYCQELLICSSQEHK